MSINKRIAEEFNLRIEQVDNTVALLDDGKTIPFIARYRKEMTGSLDDQLLRELDSRLQYLRKLDARKEEIIAAITEQGRITDTLAAQIRAAQTLVEAEDLYLPYRPKRKTRASAAIERGLEPLARCIAAQEVQTDPEQAAADYVNPEKDVPDTAAALQGAMDILAEEMANDAQVRSLLRRLTRLTGSLVSRATDETAVTPYENYYDYSEPLRRIAGHRVLALDRAEREGAVRVHIALPEGHGESILLNKYVKNDTPCGQLVRAAAADSFSRLLFPAVERDMRRSLTEEACTAAIKVFAQNLRQLLMGAPLKGQTILGVDPGYRTGCKLAVIDPTGAVLDTGVAYITLGEGHRLEEGKEILRRLMITHHCTAVSIGNGTASREAEQVVAGVIRTLPFPAAYMVVSEAGASVYSASKLAAAEFPDYDVSLRSAVSIARRLQDPLAELVKIDPQSIGVGQYQHDMPKAELTAALDGVVEGCVNEVGVELTTASHALLSHIAGISASVAKNIVEYRETNGAFTDRRELLKVKGLGPKAFEQCAGFLRVHGKNPLDQTAVHPESYTTAQQILTACGFVLADLSDSEKRGQIPAAARKIGLSAIAKQVGAGLPTVTDIVRELAKPGRDPRDELPPPLLRHGDVMELKDLKVGMELVGTVRNIVDFGAFVDCGVHEDGLVHISRISDRFIKHPSEVLHVGDVVRVWVQGVDLKKNRLSLTMRQPGV